MNRVIDIYVKIHNEYIAVKIVKHEATQACIEYYEWALDKIYKEQGNADFKSSGETFTGSTLEEVFFRISCYVNQLNHAKIESVKDNPRFSNL